jgi:anthranilate synthase component II
MKTLVIDNYDSFTYNLYQYLGELGAAPEVARNDEITLDAIRHARPERIVISPGPGSPDDPAYFGVCAEVIRELGPALPILGVCLGHQGIIHVYGGRVARAPYPVHGKVWAVSHDGSGLFQGLPSPVEAMRYHSLLGEQVFLPDCLLVNARTVDGLVMGVRHREYATHGIQFHPESIGTPRGKEILTNFLNISVKETAEVQQ